LARPYLGHYVGGHGLKTVGYTVELAQSAYDGIIQVFPFSCMPEVVAKNILPQVSQQAGIPVMSLAYDEQSGQAGVQTRLEAFVDLLRYRRLQHS
jgi:predicted nucleotide-binding protein (sugar kinase/HSP70/actin superfamily)